MLYNRCESEHTFKLKSYYSYYFNVFKVPIYRQAMVKFITNAMTYLYYLVKFNGNGHLRLYHQREFEECEILGDYPTNTKRCLHH